ncbi:DNA-processing protein DprA [Corynebacterium sp. CCM 8864]|uniref:DNA-processing protein DprA n=1 Tax=Corynebacterium marambiense TaxID=2765364 RepID=A0ABS0VT87_9CORY|nr:DNA-processing protein DprA [Corynebacterium marambiense]
MRVEENGIATLIPGDAHWPQTLKDLDDRAPSILFVRGPTSFLARPVNDLVTFTGSSTASAYGEHVAGELADDLANRATPTALKPLYTARLWLRVVTRSWCSLAVWTTPTRLAIVTCWSGWVMRVRWSVSFLPDLCRRGIGSWPAPDCWEPCQRRRWSSRLTLGRGRFRDGPSATRRQGRSPPLI